MRVVESLLADRKEAASALGVSVRSLDLLFQRGLLRPTRIGARVLVAWSELRRFAAGCPIEGAPTTTDEKLSVATRPA